jgi:hypothetical protein
MVGEAANLIGSGLIEALGDLPDVPLERFHQPLGLLAPRRP